MTYQLPEAVFRPGNLVYGVEFSLNYRSLIELGIVTPMAIEARTGINTYSLSRNFISFAMLSKAPIPDNYLWAKHHGPKRPGAGGLFHIGIVIDREALLRAFPGEVFAIGDNFLEDRDQFLERTFDPKWYDINKDPPSVFGIPVKSGVWPRYADEVRLLPSSPLEAAVSTNLWAGVVLSEKDFEGLRYVVIGDENPPKLDIPVFSTECRLLSETFDMRMKKRRK